MVRFNLRRMFSMGLLAAALTVGAGAAALHAVPGVVAMADDVAVTVNLAGYEAVITPGTDDTFVFLQVLKKKGDGYTVSSTYPYEVEACKVDDSTSENDGKVIVDLSFLKATADQYIWVYGNTTGKAYDGSQKPVTVYAQAKKLSIKYKYTGGTEEAAKLKAATEIYGHLQVKLGGESVTMTEDLAKTEYSYRSLYGSEAWAKLNKFNYSVARVAGATIVVRKDAVTETGKEAAASPEVKVKIAALPKAPKVTVDYVKGTIAISNKMEYGVLDSTGAIKWAKNPGTGKMELEKLAAEITKIDSSITAGSAFTLVVRTAGTDSKPASVETFVDIKEVVALKNLKDDGSAALGDNEEVSKGIVAKDVTPAAADPQLEYKYDSTKKGDTVKDTGMTITAKNATFEYKVGTSWKKLAAGKSVYLKGTSSLVVRLSGIKENLKASPAVEGAFPSKEITIKVKAPTTSDDGNGNDEGDDSGDEPGDEG